MIWGTAALAMPWVCPGYAYGFPWPRAGEPQAAWGPRMVLGNPHRVQPCLAVAGRPWALPTFSSLPPGLAIAKARLDTLRSFQKSENCQRPLSGLLNPQHWTWLPAAVLFFSLSSLRHLFQHFWLNCCRPVRGEQSRARGGSTHRADLPQSRHHGALPSLGR